MASSIAIIGAGIAGLSAGCYARMNGFDAHIFELHDKPGGLCTSWERNGYTFDGCLEWLVGTQPGSPFHRIWSELGALEGREIVHHEELHRYEGAHGKQLVLYRDPERLRDHLKSLAPGDVQRVEALYKAIQHFRHLRPKLERPRGLKDLAEQLGSLVDMAPAATDLVRFRKTSVKDWAADFRDPFLREALGAQFELPDFPFTAMVATLACQANSDAGYPVGGSLAFARAIEQRFLSLGGVIHYGRRVKRVVVESDRAVGLEFERGETHRADTIVSAADGHATVFQLLEGRYLDHALRERFETLPRFPSLVRVSLGVALDLSKEPHEVSFPLRHPIVIDGEPRTRLLMRHYAYDPTLAAPGKTVVVTSFRSSYEAWRTLHESVDHYTHEKRRIADDVIRAIDRRIPSFSDHLEVVDVATPLTFERYTGNWQGSMEGWLLTTRTLTLRIANTLPGLSGFFMIGQWVQPGGGVPTAAWSGRQVIRKICEQQGKVFQVAAAEQEATLKARPTPQPTIHA